MHYSFYLGDCGLVESMFHLERRNKEKREKGGDKNEGEARLIVRAQWIRLYRKKKGGRGMKNAIPNVLPVHNHPSIGSFQFFQLFCLHRPLDSKSRVKFISTDGTVIVLQA